MRVLVPMAAVWLLSTPARAVPLQDLVSQVKGSVVHLSIVDAVGEEIGSGSGFVVSDSGLVATNHHVVQGASRIEAQFEGRSVKVLGLRAYNEKADVAILQLAPGVYVPLQLSDALPRVGDPVIVVGSPRGFAGSVSTGILSARRDKSSVPKHQKEWPESWELQISAPISPGSSGSPILNEAGKVVGLAVGRYGGEALNFGVTVHRLRTELDQAKKSELLPLADMKGERTLGQNLLYTGAVVLLLMLFGLVINRVLARRERSGDAVRGGSDEPDSA